MNKKTKKKGGSMRVKGVRSMSPNRLQKSKISRRKLSSIRDKLRKISSKRNKFNRTMKSSKNRAKYGSHIKKKLNSLKNKETMLHRQIPRSPLRRIRSASAKVPDRPHNLHRRVLSKMRRPGETDTRFKNRMRRRTLLPRTHRYRPNSPVFDF